MADKPVPRGSADMVCNRCQGVRVVKSSSVSGHSFPGTVYVIASTCKCGGWTK